MKRRPLETLVKLAIPVGGIIISLMYAYSIWRPGGSGEDVPSNLGDAGAPEVVLSKSENIIYNPSEAFLYPSNVTNFSDTSQRSIIMPTQTYRFKRTRREDPKTKASVAVTAYSSTQSTKQANPILRAETVYILQFNCPGNMKSIEITYDGRLLERRIFPEVDEKGDKTGDFIVKADFSAKEGKKQAKAKVIYYNGEEDHYDIGMIGQK